MGLGVRVPGAILVKNCGRDGNVLDGGTGGYGGLTQSNRGGYERDGLGMALSGESRGLEIDSVGWGGQDLINGEVLGCEDSIETVKREGSFAVKEV